MKEIKLKLRFYGDKVLRARSAPVNAVGPQEKALIEKMAEVMYASGGIGLAAPQVGINKQIIVIDVGKGLIPLINPKIKKKEGSAVIQEGCLSVPEVYVKVRRPQKVFVEALDPTNKPIAFWADEIFGRAVQHEVDHLHGKLIVDYLNLVKRLAVRRKLKARAKKN